MAESNKHGLVYEFASSSNSSKRTQLAKTISTTLLGQTNGFKSRKGRRRKCRKQSKVKLLCNAYTHHTLPNNNGSYPKDGLTSYQLHNTPTFFTTNIIDPFFNDLITWY